LKGKKGPPFEREGGNRETYSHKRRKEENLVYNILVTRKLIDNGCTQNGNVTRKCRKREIVFGLKKK